VIQVAVAKVFARWIALRAFAVVRVIASGAPLVDFGWQDSNARAKVFRWVFVAIAAALDQPIDDRTVDNGGACFGLTTLPGKFIRIGG
jgi:hypothetical protein